MIQSYRDLDVWKKSIGLVKKVYSVTQAFPKEEMYGLVAQMRRSAVSLPSNIAEGKSRQGINEYVQFVYIALGSIAELETQTIISNELGFLDVKDKDLILEELDHLARMLRNLVKGLKTSNR